MRRCGEKGLEVYRLKCRSDGPDRLSDSSGRPETVRARDQRLSGGIDGSYPRTLGSYPIWQTLEVICAMVENSSLLQKPAMSLGH